MERKYNTTSEAAIRALFGKGIGFVDVAKQLGVSIHQLRAAASLLGIRARPETDHGAERKRKASIYLGGIARGETMEEIAAHFGVTRQTVCNTLKAEGLPTSARAYLKSTAKLANPTTDRVARTNGVDIDAVHLA
jgi:hypothetical protein